jgi:serpin B
MNKTIFSILILLVLSLLIGCTSSQNNDSGNIIDNTISTTDEYGKLIEANMKFSFNFLSTMINDKKISDNGEMKTNVFVSPLSISTALAMAYNGAMEDTKSEMAKTLQINNIDTESVNKSFQYLINIMQKDKSVETSIANSLWSRKDVSFNEAYFNNMKTYYNAKVSPLDFLDPKSVDIINNWVNEKTKGKIKKLLDELSPDAILYILNAIYFKGQWTKTFDKNKTYESNFNLENGTTKKAMMMNTSKEDYTYMENDDFQLVALPYGKEENVKMYIFLPKQCKKICDIVKNFDYNLWKKTKDSMYKTRIDYLAIPKFKIEFERTINDDLVNMGMGIAFSDGANFKNIADMDLCISKVIHKAIVEVNEEGTEAAAVTGVVVGLTSVQDTLDFIADHPFFFIIADDKTNTITFMGILNDPTV